MLKGTASVFWLFPFYLVLFCGGVNPEAVIGENTEGTTLKLPVIRDTSISSVGRGKAGNNGHSARLKLKSIQEYVCLILILLSLRDSLSRTPGCIFGPDLLLRHQSNELAFQPYLQAGWKGDPRFLSLRRDLHVFSRLSMEKRTGLIPAALSWMLSLAGDIQSGIPMTLWLQIETDGRRCELILISLLPGLLGYQRVFVFTMMWEANGKIGMVVLNIGIFPIELCTVGRV